MVQLSQNQEGLLRISIRSIQYAAHLGAFLAAVAFPSVSSTACRAHKGDVGVAEGGGGAAANELDVGLLKGTLHWPFPVPLLFGVISPFRVIHTTQRSTKLLAPALSLPSLYPPPRLYTAVL